MQDKLTQLSKLLETAQNPKILLEEMNIIAAKAFTLQGQINEELEEKEKTSTDIPQLQSIFNTREMLWDMMEQLQAIEIKIKEKTHTKQKKEPCSCKKPH